jgi:ankyrin repeat protein
MRRLLRHPGIEVNSTNRDGNTPLHYFCRTYNSPSAEGLFKSFIEKGAKVRGYLVLFY